LETNIKGGILKTLFSRRGAAVLGVLLVALFVIRPQAGRLRWRVSQSISTALGRPVQIGSLHLRFLPRLGFELEDLVVRDDPAFGSEPLLRAPDVTAWLRVTALIRGRIEISNLNLSEASLNLTRNPQGRWSLEDLLERTATISTAPTASGKPESRSEFPYIEATGARLNFKLGTEKTHFAFTDAQFALWQDSENTWGLRLKGRPIRTDANLTDTGLMNISGTWQRSAVFQDTPVKFSFQWKQAQIGQVSKLIYGSDKGWRGSAVLSGILVGTPARLKITSDGSVDDFRRYDVLAGADMVLGIHCVAEYGSAERTLSDVKCSAPAGDGSLELKASSSGWPASSYSVSLAATKVPAQSVLGLARHTGEGIPDSLIAAGTVRADIRIDRKDVAAAIHWYGNGEFEDLVLSSGNAASGLRLGRVPLSLVSDAKSPSRAPRSGTLENFPWIEVGPVSENLGRPVPLRAKVSLSLSGYQASVHGDAGIKRLLQVAQMLGVPAPAVVADGSSSVDLTIDGDWARKRRPLVLGTAQLHSVRAQVRGFNAPLEIAGANLALEAGRVRVQNLNATAAGATWSGSFIIPRPCSPPEDCPCQFSLHTVEVDATALNNLLNPRVGKQSWYEFLTPGGNPTPYLLQARATGKIAVDKLVLGKATVTQFAADVSLDQGKLTLANWRGQTLGSKALGDWKADFSVRPPVYSGSGSFEDISLTQVADLTNDGWIGGTGSAKYQFNATGWGVQDLLKSGGVNATFTTQDVDFPHIMLTNTSGPLRASDFSGKILLQEGTFSFQDAKLVTASEVYKVSGTASLKGALNLKVAGESVPGYDLSGTLIKPRVSPISTTSTQAALKP
jgi:hypothetical protein